MSRKLFKSLKAQKSQTEQVKLAIYGSLGIFLGGQKVIQVPNRQGYVYVRLRDNQNEVIQAFNNKVAASYNLPVIVVREDGRYIVQQYNSQRYQNNAQNSAPFLPGHGTQHSFPRGGGADVTWIYSQQFMPALVFPESTTGTTVRIDRYPLLNPNGQWIYAGGTGTQNILQYLPTTGSSSLMTLVYMDAMTGNPGILVGSGSYFPANITGSIYPYIPSPSSTQIPLAGVLLNTGTTKITWDNIYDVRQWIHAVPSGTSSGGGGGGGIDTIGFAGLSNGVPIGTGTFLNVHGATFTRSGTMFDLDIPSSSGYDNFWNSGTNGTYSLRVKNNTTTNALGDYAVAYGQDAVAQANYSHAEGRRTSAFGTGSHAEGYLTVAYGNHSHAEGYQTFVSGTSSFVSGDGNHNIGNYSAVLGGLNNRLTGQRSVLLGGSSRTGTADDTVYVPKLNIQTVQAGSPLILIGVDNQGMVVSGTFPPAQIGIYAYSSGTPLGTGTSINFTDGIYGVVSGTTIHVGSYAQAETNANFIYAATSPGGTSAFVGTINGAPSGANVTYNVSSGTEGSMKPSATTHLAKMRLYNTTRGTYALISDVNTGTNVITLTATAPAGWVNGDTITIASQTVTGAPISYCDFEIVSGPTYKTYLFVNLIIISATISDNMRIHPFESYGAGKQKTAQATVANLNGVNYGLLKITNNVFSMGWTGTPTNIILTEDGYLK